jgi:hypothetical protein
MVRNLILVLIFTLAFKTNSLPQNTTPIEFIGTLSVKNGAVMSY